VARLRRGWAELRTLNAHSSSSQLQGLVICFDEVDVNWVEGFWLTPGHWAHAEPAPHCEPVV
jgi:hypothetical protein